MANTERNSARLQALAAAVLFSTGGAAIKVESFSAAQVSAVRSGIATIVLLLWLRGRMRWSWKALAAGIAYAATLSLFVGATKLTTAANAIFLQSTSPLYLLLLAPTILHERIRRRDVIYLAAVAVGLIWCFVGTPAPTGTASNPSLGNWLGVASGLAWAVTIVTLRAIGRGDTNSDATLAPVVAGNAMAFLLAAPFALPVPRATAGEWITLAYLGVFQIGLAYLCLSSAIRRLPALEISLLLLIEPVLNPVWTWIIRNERPGRWTIAGGALIVSATAMKLFVDAQRPEPETNRAPVA